MKVKVTKDTAIFGPALKAGAEIEVADEKMIYAALKLGVAEVLKPGAAPKSETRNPKSDLG